MTKRRLIKKIKDISDDTLEKEVFFQPGFEPEKIISGITRNGKTSIRRKKSGIT